MADKVDKGKKRKRHTDVNPSPSKKVAIDDDRKVKISLLDPDKWAPVVGKRMSLQCFLHATDVR